MKKFLFCLIVSVSFFSCEENEPPELPETRSIQFNFLHYFGNEALQFRETTELTYSTALGNRFNIRTLKYYISKITIKNDTGGVYDVNMYKLVNPAEPDQDFQKYILENIPNGRYTELRFIYGVDSSRNVSPFGLPNNSSNNNMEWPFTLGGGYHFMILEGLVNDTSASRPIIGYAIHLGKNHNQFYANFPIDIRIDGKTTPTIDIVMNVDQWFNGKNQIFLNKDYGYIMEDDAKQLEFKENAASVFSIVQR